MRGKLVVGNWKMNGRLAQNNKLLGELRTGWRECETRQIAVCVPFPYLWQAQAALSGSKIAWGSQDVSEHENGAHTGDVAAAMVAEFGCTFTIAGHSERRANRGETDAIVAAKAAAALAAGLTPIVCVGETLAEREAGITEAVVTRQLAAVIEVLGGRIAETVIAYEPVWAIGTGKTATAGQAELVHSVLRGRLRAAGKAAGEVRVIYGGSVKASNARSLFACPDVDGALVGGASLDAQEFLSIAVA